MSRKFPKVGKCQHCGKRCLLRPRDLCYAHFEDIETRNRYPITSKFAHSTSRDYTPKSLPRLPTLAIPGSPEKVLVLQSRASANQYLWHPLDAWSDS